MEAPSPGWYRLFQRVAVVIGAITLLVGVVIGQSAVYGAGTLVLIHALVATLIIAFEDRRTNSGKTQSERH